jgi:hypothetical protein
MARRGGQPGNDNGSKNKPWADALRKAMVQYEDDKTKRGEAMAAIAKTVVQRAIIGDKDAWQEIGNRLDGKPHQTIAAEVDTSVVVEVVRFGANKTAK